LFVFKRLTVVVLVAELVFNSLCTAVP